MKGNDGRAARRLLWKRVGTVVSFFVMFIGTLHMVGFGKLRGNERQESSFAAQLRSNQRGANHMTHVEPRLITVNDRAELSEILSASMNLVDITYDPGELKAAPPDTYDGVYGEFCTLNFAVHKSNPSNVPMFRDLVAASPDCAKRRYKINLKEVVKYARQHDSTPIQQVRGALVPKALDFKGAVFHESRCGSTLVANTLIGMDPKRHRVYSESAPPLKALTLCGPPSFSQCTLEQAAILLRDVVHLMGRTDNYEEERLFFKIQSAGTHGLRVFQKAFPHVPWLFVYRDPVQVMMSHLKQGNKHANCVRSMQHPSATAKSLIQQHGYSTSSDLSPVMYCAVHLAAICEVALEEMIKTGTGMPVNYDDLPEVLYTRILPEFFHMDVSKKEIDNIQRIASVYSKGRDSRAGEWHEDSERKEQAASHSVKQAAGIFLQHSYDELQRRRVT